MRNHYDAPFKPSARRAMGRSFQAMSLSIKPQHLGNTHGLADEVGISHGAVIRGDFLFVDEDQAVVLYTVTISTEVC